MNTSRLIIAESLLSPIFNILGFIMRSFWKTYFKIFETSSNKILVIKFMGIGNFYVYDQILNKDTTLITLQSNKTAIEKVAVYNKHNIYLDLSGTVKLLISFFRNILRIFFTPYKLVINLEGESSFARFLSFASMSNTVRGLSSRHKNFLDYYGYDVFYPESEFVSRFTYAKKMLTEFTPYQSERFKIALIHQQEKFWSCLQSNKKIIKNINIYPTCSKTDKLRRYPLDQWAIIIDMIQKYVSGCKITLIFPNEEDEQFDDFNSLFLNDDSIELKITNYDEFIQSIKNNDFIVTVDSLALHIAEKYKKFCLALFSSSSPFALNITETSYPFSKALDCCPCSHRYFIPPCKFQTQCAHLERDDIEEFFTKLHNYAFKNN